MSHTLRIAFAGTPEFAAAALRAIERAQFPIGLVLTQPDRPAGRGMKLSASPVKQFALERGLPVAQPPSLRIDGRYPEQAAQAIALLDAARVDVMVVAAYGLILPRTVLDIPRHGCINIHASLLPRWRGAAPIHRAIEAGDAQTGISLMQMDAGLDTGAIICKVPLTITETDTTATLHGRLATTGAQAVLEALLRLESEGVLKSTPQPESGVTYAAKVDKREAVLDWRGAAVTLERKVRAFDPFPGAVATLDGTTLKIWAAEVDERTAPALLEGRAPGTVLAVTRDGVTVACGAGALRITCWQRPGRRRMSTEELLAGFKLEPGQRFTLFESAPSQ